MQIAPGGRRIVAGLLLLGIPTYFVTPFATLALVLAAAGTLYFYRDPERAAPASGIVSPADGTVTVCRDEDGRVRVGVFMSPRDVHVNRAPSGGTVTAVDRSPGGHRPAFSKDADANERVRIVIDDEPDEESGIVVTLIAGAFARRIRPYVAVGDAVDRGDRIGHITFGSRADVLLPGSCNLADVAVSIGDRVRAGETVIAPGP